MERQGGEGTGQQGCVKPLLPSLPPDGLGQRWLRREGPRGRPEKTPYLGREIHAEKRGKARLLLLGCSPVVAGNWEPQQTWAGVPWGSP